MPVRLKPNLRCTAIETHLRLAPLDEVLPAISHLLGQDGMTRYHTAGDWPAQTALRWLGWESELHQVNSGVAPLLRVTAQAHTTNLSDDARLFSALAPLALPADPRDRIVFVVFEHGESKPLHLAWSFESQLKLRLIEVETAYHDRAILFNASDIPADWMAVTAFQQGEPPPVEDSDADFDLDLFPVKLPGSLRGRLKDEGYSDPTDVQDLGHDRQTLTYMLSPAEITALADYLNDKHETALAKRVLASLPARLRG